MTQSKEYTMKISCQNMINSLIVAQLPSLTTTEKGLIIFYNILSNKGENIKSFGIIKHLVLVN